MARIVMDSGEGMWDKRVVANCDGHESKMKEKEAAFHNLLPHGWADHVSTISKTRYYMVRFNVQSVTSRRRNFPIRSRTCLLSGPRISRAVTWDAQVDAGSCSRNYRTPRSVSQRSCFGVYAGSRSSERCCGFPKLRVNDAEHHNFLHTHRASLYANVGLLMILADVPMQTSICVMDEVAKLFEHVEIDIPNSSTEISGMKVWTGQGGTSVVPGIRQWKKLRGIVTP